VKQIDKVGSPSVLVSWGELIDKVTILEIKEIHITSTDALRNVSVELGVLSEMMNAALTSNPQIQMLKDKLSEINQKIWDVEDAIRRKEACKDFGNEFIELARSVYIANDQRAAVKREINQLMKSALTEEKSYQAY
jgi:predicted  nucleic acid-binding Zn-ribbon protein